MTFAPTVPSEHHSVWRIAVLERKDYPISRQQARSNNPCDSQIFRS